MKIYESYEPYIFLYHSRVRYLLDIQTKRNWTLRYLTINVAKEENAEAVTHEESNDEMENVGRVDTYNNSRGCGGRLRQPMEEVRQSSRFAEGSEKERNKKGRLKQERSRKAE